MQTRAPNTPELALQPEPPTPDVVDGVTGENDGGREDGDVELALFRRIRSRSGSAARNLYLGPSAGYRRYFDDPLSMFSYEADNQPDLHSQPTDDDPPAPKSNSIQGEQDRDDSVEEKSEERDEINAPSTNGSPISLTRNVPSGVAWRDAMVQTCADLLGKKLEDLDREYNVALAAASAPNTAFATENAFFEPTPRDLADYIIMTTLKVQDSFAMRNATSWLFNMMDRTGSGFVLREEFVRYAPFIGPVSDAAVAGLVFDELIREQVRILDEEAEIGLEDNNSANGRRKDRSKEPSRVSQRGLRKRPGSYQGESRRKSHDGKDLQHSSHQSTLTHSQEGATSANSAEGPLKDLYPPAAALRFDLWRLFFLAVQDKYHYHEPEWNRVKRELGIDPSEIIIKSQGAVDHSDVFPTLGKLFLSQRYLIFFAAVGRNHYVARLGSVADVTTSGIPLLMRDLIQIHLDSETKAALEGVSGLNKGHHGKNETRDKSGGEPDGRQEPTLSQHVGKLMKNFTSRRKPLQFSFIEFRETKRRDNWVQLVKEMVAAHKLHVQLGFGSSGRAVPPLEEAQQNGNEVSGDGASEDDERNDKVSEIRNLNYSRSPFRNEPSPPLLAVAAHANIVRYRALRRVTEKRTSNLLLIFSHVERNTHLVNWYTDSVRAYDKQNGRTWIERAVSAIRENMETNNRIYHVRDDEPFDVTRLGDAIGRFAELCSPLVRVIEFLMHLFQWRNPPATILAILSCLMIAIKGWLPYIPAALVFLQAAWVVETKYNWFGLGMGRAGMEDAERRKDNVLRLVAQVHDTLAAAQNVLGGLNGELGKVESVFLWGCEEWQSWVVVGALCGVGAILLMVPGKYIFCWLFVMCFFKHFMPPTNPWIKFWQTIPPRAVCTKERRRRSRPRPRLRSIPPPKPLR